MGWFAYQTQAGSWVSAPDEIARNNLLPVGTIQFQVKITDCAFDAPLLKVRSENPWPHEICFALDQRGNPTLTIQRDGTKSIKATSTLASRSALSDMLVTYAWDAPNRLGRLTVANAGSFQGETLVIENAPPLFKTDVLELALQAQNTPIDFVALSDRAEPVGPMPGIDALTLIDTPLGPKRAGEIKSGDMIETDIGPQTVLARVKRCLPMAGAFTPIRLHAPFHGLKRHMSVAHHQTLVFGGADVEYAFGGSTVHIPAGLLETRRQPAPEWGTRAYCQFVLPKPAGIFAQGAILGSLNIGRIRRSQMELAISLLGGIDPKLLPDHGDAPPQALPEFAARTLASGRLG